MKNLLDHLSETFDDGGTWIRIVDATWFADDLTLDLSIQSDGGDPSLWEVACEGVVEESISSRGASGLALSDRSPLLIPLLEPDVPIMFSENAMAPEALLGLVCACCLEVLGKTASVFDFMNDGPGLDALLRSKYGLLGRFPESLAAQIIGALKDKPILVNALPGKRPTRWDGVSQVPYQGLQVLEIGRSYVIAQQFSAVHA